MTKILKRLLITGAGGGLGKIARERLGYIAETIRVSDIVDMGEAAPHEEVVPCDLADYDAVNELVAGCDGVVHFGGISGEDTFSKILKSNIEGVYNLYEAVRKNGSPRVFMASSNHVIGFYRQDEHLDANAPLRPDGLYGVSKCFAEAMASMYHDKFGIETALVRIGSSFPEATNRRFLATWLSYDDLISLIVCVFEAPRLGCPVIYGVSDNDTIWWDNSATRYLGWRPKDNSAVFRDRVYANEPDPGPDDPTAVYQGGKFTQDPILED